ncbi:MAG: amino acid permease [Cyclobacteriaceae bacterium]|jgi:APA family basic amino acid/polyamine antiporter|nr:amino acid permease [Cyclobacteriaceae bacterium]
MTRLARTFGLWSSVSLIVGGIIGSAIFMKPALMASQLGSPVLLLAVWVVGGLITLCGALTNAEVAAMLPETGGQYVFFQKMYGDFVAFLYGWAAFAVFNTAGVASIAYVFAIYAEYFYSLPRFSPETELLVAIYLPGIGHLHPLENIGVKALTIVLVAVLSWVNIRSVAFGGRIQVVFTALKVAAMAVLVVGLLLSGKGDWSSVITSSTDITFSDAGLLLAIIAATSGAFWGYDGWNNITFVAGEVKNPQRNIPLSLLIGLSLTIVIYGLVVLAYTYILPIDDMAASSFVGSDAATRAFGLAGGGLIAALVMLSTFGTTNGNILATARVTFAMAQEKRFFAGAGAVHPRFQSPARALAIHAVWTSLLVLSGSFDMLTDMLVFVSWLFYGLSAYGVFILRKKMADVPRPYKVWGYPWVPGLFVAFTGFFLVATLYNDTVNYLSGHSPLINSLFGLLLTALGIPLYFYFRQRTTA